MNRFLRGSWALAVGAIVALAGCQDEKTCEDFCGTGAACVGGSCVTVEQCAPACDTGELCQGTGAAASCVPLLSSACAAAPCDAATEICLTAGGAAECVAVCGAGQAWNSSTRQCEATAAYCADGMTWDAAALKCVAPACEPACGACQVCDTSGAAPACKNLCGSDSTCDAATNTCVPVVQFHATTPTLAGPFTSGYQVSEKCTGCHPAQAAAVMQTLHWTWQGPTPTLGGLTDFAYDGTLQDPGDLGKVNLINNFCVAVPSNEKRCDQCHAGYGGDPDLTKPQKSARAYTVADSSIPLEHRVDCLVCHSDPVSGYAKDAKNFGNPAATVNLARAAQLVRRTPTRQNCGVCHFYAGGGDNVKLMGSSLRDPTESIDVHMGRNMDCAACHADPGHQFRGAGIHVPANHARSSCEDCHGPTPHEGKFSAGATIDRHTDALACQTCHIPTFSRGQFAKMNWDWSTAGDKSRGVNGVVTQLVDDLGAPDPAGTSVVTYDYIKGDFLWQRNVKPAYAWYNGGMTHVTTRDKGALTGETGLTPADADRVTLGAPLGGPADATAKIHPFKLMRGRQAFYVDGASSFVVTPNVFGPAGFWGVVQSAGYTFDPATSTYTAPNAATPVTTPTPIDDLWSAVFTKGSTVAGQVPAGTPTFAKSDGASAGWAWRYTKLYMDLNHEVAPKAQALGAGGNCAACHSGTPVIDWSQLGYACGDPMGCPKRP